MSRHRLWIPIAMLAAGPGSGCRPDETPDPAAAEADSVPVAPNPEIFVGTLTTRDGNLEVGDLHNATRRPGYDNQPFFTSDGRAVLYSFAHEGQNDINRLPITDSSTESPVAVTRTPESEYSPTPMPGDSTFSVVRVEADSAQRLWQFDFQGNPSRVLLPAVQPVGYHAWITDRLVALFVLGDPPTLQVADVSTQQVEEVAADIGRSLHRVPGRAAVSFVDRSGDTSVIRIYDVETREFETVAPTLPDSEDYVWTPEGTLLMGSGSVLHSWDPTAEQWRVLRDLSAAGLGQISRLAISPDGSRIAVVAEPIE